MPEVLGSLAVSAGEPASRRGKNASPAADRWHTFIYRGGASTSPCGAPPTRFLCLPDRAASRARRRSPPAGCALERVARGGASPSAAQAPPPWRVCLAPRTGVPAARSLRGGVAADGETPRQDPW